MKRENLNPETHEFLSEWDYEKNKEFRPEIFTAASNKKVWWKCRLGHSWSAMITNRSKGQHCPYCIGRRVLKGFNDLVTTHPEIANEWDYEKNKPLRPEQFTIGSHKKVWWKCEHGHSWDSRIYCRKKNGCRYCYANHNEATVQKNHAAHRADSELLVD